MSAAWTIALLWVVFAGSHVLLSSRALRPRLVAALGSNGYLGLFSGVAVASFVPLVWIYFAGRTTSPWLWVLPRDPWLLWIVYIGVGVAFTLVVASFVTPSPASIGASDTSARGVLRITRHPLVMGLGLYGLFHLLPNGRAADLAFFGGFPLFALWGGWHQDRRKRTEQGEAFARFAEATPFLPFTGRETLQGLRELGPLVLLLGIGLTIGVRYFHASLFGP